MKKLEEYKYMKPHYTKPLEPMIDYLVSQNDFSSVPNDMESLKSKISINYPSYSKMELYDSNFKTSSKYQITPSGTDAIRKLYN